MTALLWLLIVLSFIVAFVALVVPAIPGILFMWIGFLIYHFGINNDALSWFFWIGMLTFTVIILISDYVLGGYFVKRYGGTKPGEITAAIGILVGSFILPPFGIIIVPFVAVLIIEFIMVKDLNQAFKSSIGSIFGFLTSSVAKFMILILMILWFSIDIALG